MLAVPVKLPEAMVMLTCWVPTAVRAVVMAYPAGEASGTNFRFADSDTQVRVGRGCKVVPGIRVAPTELSALLSPVT